jgi:hypothetical protein
MRRAKVNAARVGEDVAPSALHATRSAITREKPRKMAIARCARRLQTHAA